jgi:hypothetical protein
MRTRGRRTPNVHPPLSGAALPTSSSTPRTIEKAAPERKIISAARNDKKKRSFPCPKGCSASGGRSLNESESFKKTWCKLSATECAASASIALEPVTAPAAPLAAWVVRFAASAK